MIGGREPLGSAGLLGPARAYQVGVAGTTDNPGGACYVDVSTRATMRQAASPEFTRLAGEP